MKTIKLIIDHFQKLAKDLQTEQNLTKLKEDLQSSKVKTDKIPVVDQKKKEEDKKEEIPSKESQPVGFEGKTENELKKTFLEIAQQGRYKKIKQIFLDPAISAEVKATLINTFINNFSEEFKRTFIEQNDDLPAHLLEELFLKSSSDIGPYQRNWRVLKAICAHKNAPESILKLAADPESELKPDARVRMDAVANKNLKDAHFLGETYKKEINEDVKNAYLKNPHTPTEVISEVFHQFKDDKNQTYHKKIENLAKNPNTSSIILIEILIETLNHLFEDAKVPIEITRKTLQSKIKQALQSSKLLSLRKDSVPLKIITAIVSNPNLKSDAALFRIFATAVHPEIKLAIAQNPNTPKDILETLTKIPDIAVADAARKTLTSK